MPHFFFPSVVGPLACTDCDLRVLKGTWKVFTLLAKDTRLFWIHLVHSHVRLGQLWCKLAVDLYSLLSQWLALSSVSLEFCHPHFVVVFSQECVCSFSCVLSSSLEITVLVTHDTKQWKVLTFCDPDN